MLSRFAPGKMVRGCQPAVQELRCGAPSAGVLGYAGPRGAQGKWGGAAAGGSGLHKATGVLVGGGRILCIQTHFSLPPTVKSSSL